MIKYRAYKIKRAVLKKEQNDTLKKFDQKAEYSTCQRGGWGRHMNEAVPSLYKTDSFMPIVLALKVNGYKAPESVITCSQNKAMDNGL